MVPGSGRCLEHCVGGYLPSSAAPAVEDDTAQKVAGTPHFPRPAMNYTIKNFSSMQEAAEANLKCQDPKGPIEREEGVIQQQEAVITRLSDLESQIMALMRADTDEDMGSEIEIRMPAAGWQ